MARVAFTCLMATVLIVGSWGNRVGAAVPTESLLPATTKGFLSFPDYQETKARWDSTQLGQLMNDPIMEPFVKDLGEQLQGKRGESSIRLGVTTEELEAVAGGEVVWAVIQPGGDARQQARVLLADVTGHRREAQELLAKIGRNLVTQGAVRTTSQVGGLEVVKYLLPRQRDQLEQRAAYHFLHQDLLVTSDHDQEARNIIKRLQGTPDKTLQGVRAFQESMRQAAAAMGSQATHVRWFVEPFGYMEVSRVIRGEQKRRGTDILQVLRNQGFDAIEGVGGLIALKTADHELVHRTLIFAPGQTGVERFRLAARMLEFPNGPTPPAQNWVPREIASYLTWNWKMQDAFEHSKTLVNELAGSKADEDLFEDIIGSIRDDVAGPRVDLRSGLVRFLGERATMVTDYRLPITPQSERWMVAVQLTDATVVDETITKVMEADPDAQPRKIDGHVVWEIVNEKPAEVEEIRIVGAGFGGFNDPEPEDEEEEEERVLPNMAVTVAHDHLFVASHVDFIADMLKQAREKETLAVATDFVQINKSLEKLGAQQQSFRFFTRTDEAYRPTYELIRMGKMPESETMLGRLLNRMMGSSEKGVVREQEIDGSKMPSFDKVKQFLGPAGVFITTQQDGWFVTGCLDAK